MAIVTRKWTRAEYERLTQLGLLAEDERVELIQGEIVAMSPIDPIHAIAVNQANMVLATEFGATHVVGVQNPLVAGEDSEPQPDLILISRAAFAEMKERREHPARAVLVLEVANTSLAYDRREKGSLYALAGQPLYWIVNVVHNQLEVYSNPVPDPAAPFGFSYASFQSLGRGQKVELAGRTLAVDDFLA